MRQCGAHTQTESTQYMGMKPIFLRVARANAREAPTLSRLSSPHTAFETHKLGKPIEVDSIHGLTHKLGLPIGVGSIHGVRVRQLLRELLRAITAGVGQQGNASASAYMYKDH